MVVLSKQKVNTVFLFSGFFIGCLRNIKYGVNETSLETIHDIPRMRSFVNPGNVCDLNLCNKRRKDKPPGICENNGVCLPNGESSASCDCRWTGFDGNNCSEGMDILML